MADSEVATRAPESDAQEQPTSPVAKESVPLTAQEPRPHDEPSNRAATMSDHCTTDRPTPSTLPDPSGEITTLNGTECYITKPASYPSSPAKLLIFLTGDTGIHSKNNQLQADAFTTRGFLVVMPDQFAGDPAPKTSTATHTDAEKAMKDLSIIERVKLGAAGTAKSFMIDMWLARHSSESVLPRVRAALDGAKEQYADAVANGDGVYGAGYCFGAKYVLQLCARDQKGGDDAEQATAAKLPEFKCGAIAHGTLVTKDDMEYVKSPIAMACVRDDNLFPNDVREQGKASLELNAVDHDIRVFENVPHGFAVVGEYEDHTIQTAQSAAFEMMSGWLETH